MKNGIENPNKYDPNLPGELDEKDRRILKELECICPKIEDQLKRQTSGILRSASAQIYNDLSSISGAIIAMLLLPRTPKIAIAVLFGSLIDCCISIFVFSKKPHENASIYHNFSAVLDWNFACTHEKNLGCPFVPDTQEKRNSIQVRKDRAANILKQYGLSYTKNPMTQTQLNNALAGDRITIFRDSWYEETRKQVLEREKMLWIYDILYKRYSSAVHSDSAGSFVIGVEKSHVLTLTLNFWGAGIYCLVEALNIRMNAEHKGIVRQDYEYLQGKRRLKKKKC